MELLVCFAEIIGTWAVVLFAVFLSTKIRR